MLKHTYHIKNWKFKEKDEEEWNEANVPSTVHMDLYKNHLIPHPFEKKNEIKLQWIDKMDWIYRTEIEITKDMLKHDHIDLVFEGLDTFATVYVNQTPLIEADNMYREWKVNIKSHVDVGINEVIVYLHSPIKRGLERLKHSPYPLPAPNDDSIIGGLGDHKVSVFIRKAPYHFGWDWGPRFVTSGIWKDVKIECWSSVQIEDLYIQQNQVNEEKADVTAVVSLLATERQLVTVSLKANGKEIIEKYTIDKGETKLKIPLSISNPKLWWTHDLGDQPLYDFTVTVTDQKNSVNEKSVKTGLREIRFVTEPDARGNKFQFELNGIPIFIKGTNHIPLDAFLPEIEDERYIKEIDSVVKANMNMIRVWGGGIYERDIFYEQCDERGLLVWQDFMFACSMYPGDTGFLQNVKAELDENIRRLRNHPSIAIWCGNNEIDSMWKEYGENTAWGWGWKSQYSPEERKEVWAAYETIFHKLIPDTLDEWMPDNNYWPSSPMAELTGDENQHASLASHKGDIHFWNVWHSHADIEEYNNFIGRFMSEYGFQSFPDQSTYERIAPGYNLSIESGLVNHHQKNKSGNDLILYYLDRYYKNPKDFDSYIYLSQQLQGYAFDTAIRSHRKAMPYCMGTLYWQLNDSWPGASWSSIDYYGNWKSSHYAVKEAYKKTILVFEESDNELKVFGVTDQLTDETYTLHIAQNHVRTGEEIQSKVIEVSLPANTSTLIYTIDTANISKDYSPNEIFLNAQLISDSGKNIESINHFFEKLKEIALPHPKIDYTFEKTSKGIVYTLSTDAFAKNVKLDSNITGHFEENHFDLLANEEKEILFIPEKEAAEYPISISSMIDYI